MSIISDVIGEGAYGCAIKPSLKCSNKTIQYNNKISKVLLNKHANEELTEYNKRDMTIVFPDKGANPANPSGALCRAYGCQMVAMRYQLVDNLLTENDLFFDRGGYAFTLKPKELRYMPVTIPTPTPQNPDYSYATREAKSDFYNFKY